MKTLLAMVVILGLTSGARSEETMKSLHAAATKAGNYSTDTSIPVPAAVPLTEADVLAQATADMDMLFNSPDAVPVYISEIKENQKVLLARREQESGDLARSYATLEVEKAFSDVEGFGALVNGARDFLGYRLTYTTYGFVQYSAVANGIAMLDLPFKSGFGLGEKGSETQIEIKKNGKFTILKFTEKRIETHDFGSSYTKAVYTGYGLFVDGYQAQQ